MKNNYIIGTKNESFGPGGIQNAINDTLVKTKGAIDAKLIDKNINNNGTYSASAEGADGFKKVVVDVPNTYFLSDEGKVVSNGNLVEQTEITVTENGTIDTTFNNSVIVDVPSAPAPVGTKSGAIIRDYDGSVIASYTPTQFAALSAYPAQPVHTGLTGQGYNWTLANAKAYVAKYGYIEVGATYITDDGKTKYYILIQEVDTEGTISLGLNGTAVIDWGDGSETDTITGEDIDTQIDTTHTYTTVGKYTITINVTNGNASLMGIQSLKLIKVEIGSGVTSISHYIFDDCYALTSVTIPEGVTSIGESAFRSCYALTSVTIPEGVTSIGYFVFSGCHALTSVTIPEGVTSIGNNMFTECYTLTSVTIPDGVTYIGGYVFNGCYALTSVTIPDGVTEIGSSGSVFNGCYALTSVTIPDGVTSISNYMFENCYALTSFTIPDGVTSISNNTFENCYALTSFTFPEGVTSIDENVFKNCYALTSITFEPTTPPEINSSTFADLNPFCTIYVPQGTLEAYTTAENYPNPTLYTYVEY